MTFDVIALFDLWSNSPTQEANLKICHPAI